MVVCMRPSVDFTPIYSHGFGNTVHSATVEANKDGDARMIMTLRPSEPLGAAPVPAAELFNRWTGGAFDKDIFLATGKWPAASLHPPAARPRLPKVLEAQNILGRGSYFPLSATSSGGATQTADSGADSGEATT